MQRETQVVLGVEDPVNSPTMLGRLTFHLGAWQGGPHLDSM